MAIKRVSPEFEQVLAKLKKQVQERAGLEISDAEATKILARMAERTLYINENNFINKRQIPRSKKVKLEFDFKL